MKSLQSPEVTAEITARLGQLRPESQRRWGKMSAPQAVCHMADAFRLYLGEREVKSPARPHLPTAMRWAALWTPIPWPHGFRTVSELDQEAGGTRPEVFDADRRALQQLIARFTQLPANFAFKPHPILGTMSYRSWMRLAYRHTDHHLRQFGC